MISIKNLAGTIKSHRNFVKLFWIGTLLVNVFVVGIVALVIEHNREREVAQATLLTQNYSKVLEENLAGFISKIDITLLTVREEIARQMAHGGINEKALEAFLARQDTHIPEALGLRVVDAQGIIRYAVNDVKIRNASIADRPQFIRLRDDPKDDLVFSKPVFGRAAQKWMITLGRRINNPDGSFAGDVHVAVEVDHFIKMFSKTNLGPKGNIGLWDDTSLIARYTKDDAHGASVGSAKPSPELRNLINSSQREAVYHTRSGVDGIARTFYFSHVDKYPLHLVVGLAEEDYLTEWQNNSLKIAILTSLFVIITVISSWLIYLGWKQREADQEALLRQETEYTAKLERSNQETEVARRQNELILTSAGEGICGVDREGKVVFVNPTARKLFGWAEDEGVGLDLHDHTHHHHLDGTPYRHRDCAVFKTLHDGERRQAKEDTYWRKDGTSFPVESTVTALDQDGHITGAVYVFRDISERKRAEEELRQLNITLDQRVREEVARNLDQERLLVHQSRLAAMGEMIGNIAHQWRQPLNALGLLLANIKDANDFHELDTTTIETSVAKGHQLINQMSTTIDDFKNFFRPNKLKEDFNLRQSTEDALNLVNHSFKNHNITVSIDGGEDVVAHGFPNEFSQVLLNLLNNAKDALLEREISSGLIEIRLGCDAPNAFVVVKDNAGGIPAEIFPKIFDPYFTTKEKGTGIGLYMSKMIIEHMDGTIDANNVEDGAEFRLILPKLSQ